MNPQKRPSSQLNVDALGLLTEKAEEVCWFASARSNAQRVEEAQTTTENARYYRGFAKSDSASVES
jgi:hypothetical protein